MYLIDVSNFYTIKILDTRVGGQISPKERCMVLL